MASAGSIFVDLLLKDQNYVQGLDRARTRTKQATNDMGAGFISLKGAAAAATSVISAGVIFDKFIQNTINAEKEQAQLSATLMATGNAAGYTIDQLNAMASAMSQSSIFSAGEITDAQTRLLSYVGVLGDNIPRAMQAVIDQSTRLGISLTQSAETVGRALERPSKAAAALSRQGFGSYFSKEVIEMLKSLEQQGRVAEAQIKILEVLEESYGGAALAARETLGGALANLNNTVNDLLTSEGGLPGLTEAINNFSGILRIAADEGGILNAAINRLAISYLKFIEVYNKVAASNAEKFNFFGLNDDKVKKYQDNVDDAIAAQQKLIEEMSENAAKNKIDFSAPALPPNQTYTPEIDEKAAREATAAAKRAAQELQSAYERNRAVILGVNDATLRYNDTIAELDLLLGAGRISQDQYSDALLRVQEEFDKSQEKAKVWSFSIEDAAEQASKNIQSTFADFLFDPFDKGLDGMLEGFANTLRRMAAEAASAQILGSIFGEGGFSFGSAAQSAPAKSIFDGLFDGFFADGGYIQPGHFGIAGEAGAELVYGGMSGATVIPQGGGGVSINIINNNNSSVTQSSQKTANGTDITVMIDAAVAANIGTPGTRTNQALGAFSNRSLVRR